MKDTKQVIISIRGALENGEIFEQTPEEHPIPVVLGQDNIFPKLEETLMSMQPGETKTISLAPEEAYGPHHEDLVQTLNISSLRNSIKPEPGMILALSVEKEGRQEKVPATVIEVDDNSVTVDYNHPLAGKTVVYTITLHNFI